MGRPPKSEAERFWVKVRKTQTCWLWEGSTVKGGYGQFRRDKEHGFKMVKAHVWAYEQENGPINNLGLHHCDTPNCVRPNHIYDGTYVDNMADRRNRGRVPDVSGVRNPMFGHRYTMPAQRKLNISAGLRRYHNARK